MRRFFAVVRERCSEFAFLYRIMAPIPIDPDYMWNYSFCELMDLEVEIDNDWYRIGNIEYDALEDLRGDFHSCLRMM
jgi:hypothetical protein